MAKYLDSTGLTHLWAKIKNYVQTYVSNLNLADTYVAKESGKCLSTNDYTTDEKTKLSNIASGAEVNQNAFSNVKVGSTTVAADAKTDTLILAAGGDVTITPDATNDKVTISVTTPKKVSDLTNDSGFITLSQVPEGVSTSSIGAIPESQKGVANGVATLDTNGLIPSTQLPSYVDDVVEVYARSGQTALSQNWFATESASGTVVTPTAGKIYVLMADSGDYSANSQFRWGSSTYVKLNDGGVSAITNAEIDSITSN